MIPKIPPQDAQGTISRLLLYPLHTGLAHGPQPKDSVHILQHCSGTGLCSPGALLKKPTAVLHNPGQHFPLSSFTPGERRQGMSHCHFCKALLVLLPTLRPTKHHVPSPKPQLFGKYILGLLGSVGQGVCSPVNLPVPRNAVTSCNPRTLGHPLTHRDVLHPESPPTAGFL